MFILKVFLIFSYSSVFDKIQHGRQRFLSAGSPAAVWCVVVWSRLTYVLGFIQKQWKCKKKTKKDTHELLNRTTVGLHMKVLFKGFVVSHAHAFLFSFASLCHCICFTVKLDLKTWSLRALKAAGQRCQWKQTRCPGRPPPGPIQRGCSLFYHFGFHMENKDSRPSGLFCNIHSVFHTPISSFFSSLCDGIMSWASVYLSVHFYVWMIVLCLYIWIVFYTLPQHLSGQLSVFFVCICVFILFFFCFFFIFIAVHIAVVLPWISLVLLQQLNGSRCWDDFFQKLPSLRQWLQEMEMLYCSFSHICCHQ